VLSSSELEHLSVEVRKEEVDARTLRNVYITAGEAVKGG